MLGVLINSSWPLSCVHSVSSYILNIATVIFSMCWESLHVLVTVLRKYTLITHVSERKAEQAEVNEQCSNGLV